jgi:hypothetical protein
MPSADLFIASGLLLISYINSNQPETLEILFNSRLKSAEPGRAEEKITLSKKIINEDPSQRSVRVAVSKLWTRGASKTD